MKKKSLEIIFGLLLLCGVVFFAGCGKSQSATEQQSQLRSAGMKAMSEGNLKLAVSDFDQALKKSNGEIGEIELDLCYQKGICQYKAGLKKEALETLTALLKYDERDSKAYYLRGTIYMAEKSEEKAIRDFNQAVEYEKQEYELYIGIYQQLMDANLLENAKDYLKLAEKIDGDSPKDNREKGRICLLLKDYEQAKKYLDLALNEKDEDAKLYMARLLEETGNVKQAYSVYESYANSNKKDGNAQNKLGLILMDAKDYKGAVNYFQKAIASGTVDDVLTTGKNMIVCYEKQADYKNAFQAASDLAKKFPQDLEIKKECLFLSTRISEE
jgi:tetratricopeptide (TPR) repeat protein